MDIELEELKKKEKTSFQALYVAVYMLAYEKSKGIFLNSPEFEETACGYCRKLGWVEPR